MGISKPSIPKGTRDFGPVTMSKRSYIFNTIREVFQKHGYEQIETPSMENLDMLLGKYGEEGDKLLFKILNSGDFIRGVKDENIQSADPNALSLKICEKGLRYDLTVPFARFVVQHQHEISFPFKRYQIQPVWRADRPQKGRYREFYQCDADIIGSDSLLNELDLLHIIVEVFKSLDIGIRIKINNRKILAGIAEFIGHPEKITDITMAIDKYDKIGHENVNRELASRGISPEAISELDKVLLIEEKDNLRKLDELRKVLHHSSTGLKGIEELDTLLDLGSKTGIYSDIDLDLTLARGLNYYTGAIIEVKALNTDIGSICGGGRYDDLTGIFGLEDISGVGISFGADRIYDVMDQKELFPSKTVTSLQVLVAHFGDDELSYCLDILHTLHQSGIAAELYPDNVKLKKQLSYANSRNVKYVIMAGEEEKNENMVTVKDMHTGQQQKIVKDQFTGFLIKEL